MKHFRVVWFCPSDKQKQPHSLPFQPPHHQSANPACFSCFSKQLILPLISLLHTENINTLTSSCHLVHCNLSPTIYQSNFIIYTPPTPPSSPLTYILLLFPSHKTCINIMANLRFSSVLVILTFFHTTSAQTAPSGPTNITQVLEKAGQFTTFIKLLKATQVADRINAQLNNSNQGLTIFAPTDNAFASLKSGTLNSINSQEQLQLVQFHILPNLYTMSQFQTASNPLQTQAGNGGDGQFPLNVTTSGNQVNVTTGVVDATVANTIYSDSQLAVYQVDQVLLPLSLFGAPPTAAPAPAPTRPEKNVRAADSPSSTTPVNTSGVPGLIGLRGKGVILSIAVIAATASCLWL